MHSLLSKCSVSSVAAFENVCLSDRCSRSLKLFRLRIAPINRNFQLDAPVTDRLCVFCVKSTYGRFIEDEYHVCFDCPLYESLRCKLLLKLVELIKVFVSSALDSNKQ